MQEVVDAAILACSKTRKLSGMALAIFQKMLFNQLLSRESRQRVIQTLQQVSASKTHDEDTIKLKLLQTCLTILQLRDSVDDPDEARQVPTVLTAYRVLCLPFSAAAGLPRLVRLSKHAC